MNQNGDVGLIVNGGAWYGHSGSGLFLRRGRHYVLGGVVYALHRPDNPRSPVKCVSHQEVVTFLKDYSTMKELRKCLPK